MTCPYIIVFGDRKGELCGRPSKFGVYCGIHKLSHEPRQPPVNVDVSYAQQVTDLIKKKLEEHKLNNCHLWIAILISGALSKRYIRHDFKIGYVTIVKKVSFLHFWVKFDNKIFDANKLNSTDIEYSTVPLGRVMNDNKQEEQYDNIMMIAIAAKFAEGKEDIWKVIDKHCSRLMTPQISTFIRDVKSSIV